jgi:hypothetical protein
MKTSNIHFLSRPPPHPYITLKYTRSKKICISSRRKKTSIYLINKIMRKGLFTMILGAILNAQFDSLNGYRKVIQCAIRFASVRSPPSSMAGICMMQRGTGETPLQPPAPEVCHERIRGRPPPLRPEGQIPITSVYGGGGCYSTSPERARVQFSNRKLEQTE